MSYHHYRCTYLQVRRMRCNSNWILVVSQLWWNSFNIHVVFGRTSFLRTSLPRTQNRLNRSNWPEIYFPPWKLLQRIIVVLIYQLICRPQQYPIQLNVIKVRCRGPPVQELVSLLYIFCGLKRNWFSLWYQPSWCVHQKSRNCDIHWLTYLACAPVYLFLVPKVLFTWKLI